MKHFYPFIFFIFLSLPLFLFVTGMGPQKIRIGENRKLAEWPQISEISPKKIEDYFCDHIPLRTQFTFQYITLWETRLSAWVRRYVKGRNGHYYPNYNAAPILECYLGLKPIPKQLLYDMRNKLLGIQAFWESQGAKYLSVFIPDKTSLYPEFLPFWVKKKQSWSDQIQPFLQNKSLHYLDFTQILSENKQMGQLYDKRHDTVHWNGLALSIFYKEIVKILELSSSSSEPYKLENKDRETLFLTNEKVPFMILNQENLTQQYPNFNTLQTRLKWQGFDKIINNKATDNKDVLLFLTDSYFKATHQIQFPNANGNIFPLVHNVDTYLHGHYGLTHFPTLLKIANQEKPTVVIETFAERAAKGITIRWIPDYLLIAGERLSEDNYLEVTPFTSIHPINTILTKGIILGIEAINDDPQLLLPNQTTNNDGRIAFAVKLNSPHKTNCQLFYSQGNETFSEKKSIIKHIKKGVNYIHMKIYAKENAPIRLRFDPGKKKGNYEILLLPETEEMIKEHKAHGI